MSRNTLYDTFVDPYDANIRKLLLVIMYIRSGSLLVTVSFHRIFLDLDCFDFSSKKFSNTVGELNPMLEYMPHTENGAPFTLSHNPYTASSHQEGRLWNEGEQQSYYYPYFNAARNRESNEDFFSQNKNFAYSSPLFSREEKMSEPNYRMNEPNYRFLTNYATSYDQRTTTAKSEVSPWQGIVGLQNKLENFGTPSYQSSYISSEKRRHREGSTSRHLAHKLFQRNRKHHKQNRHSINRKSTNHKFYKDLARSFKKDQTRRKQKHLNSSHPYRIGHRKHLRIQRIFNFKSVRRNNRMHRKKHKLHNKDHSMSGWKRSFHVKDKQRRHYEQIVNLLFDAFKTVHEKKYSSHHEHETRKDIYRHNLR